MPLLLLFFPFMPHCHVLCAAFSSRVILCLFPIWRTQGAQSAPYGGQWWRLVLGYDTCSSLRPQALCASVGWWLSARGPHVTGHGVHLDDDIHSVSATVSCRHVRKKPPVWAGWRDEPPAQGKCGDPIGVGREGEDTSLSVIDHSRCSTFTSSFLLIQTTI